MKFWRKVCTRDTNFGIVNIQMILKALRLGEVTKGVSVDGAEEQDLSPGCIFH